ncbi:MAG: hypothetical protein DRI46_09140 [Chloroflexi bacterium]|nr:MAG: hypothetical protein DRI46_09140 [Chloroflexota bacterium]
MADEEFKLDEYSADLASREKKMGLRAAAESDHLSDTQRGAMARYAEMEYMSKIKGGQNRDVKDALARAKEAAFDKNIDDFARSLLSPGGETPVKTATRSGGSAPATGLRAAPTYKSGKYGRLSPMQLQSQYDTLIRQPQRESAGSPMTLGGTSDLMDLGTI